MIRAWNRFRIPVQKAPKHYQLLQLLYWRCGISATTAARRYLHGDDDIQFTPSENSVYIGNLSHDVTEQELRTLVERFGTIRDYHFVKMKGGKTLQSAYVDFEETLNAKAAVNRLHKLHFHKHVLKVQPFRQQKEDEKLVSVMIEGLVPETEPKSLRTHLERVGNVRSVQLFCKNNTNNNDDNEQDHPPYWYGIGVFRTMESVRLAEKYLHNSKLHGTSIQVRTTTEDDHQLIEDAILKPVPIIKPEDALVYVGNLNRHIDWWSIHDFLLQAGLVRSLNIYETLDDDRQQQQQQQVFGIASYSRTTAAIRAVDMLNQSKWNAMEVKLLNPKEHESITNTAKLLEKRGQKRRDRSYLFVGNIAHYTTALQLRAHMSQVGILRNLKVVKNMWKQTIAYVRYKSPYSANRAVQELHRSVLDRNRIQVIPQVSTYRLDEGHRDWDEWWILVEKVDPKAKHVDLHRLAQRAGPVKSCSLFRNHFGDLFGIVRYEHRRGRDRALQVLQNALLLDHPIQVRAPELEQNDLLHRQFHHDGIDETASAQGSDKQNHDDAELDEIAPNNNDDDDKEIKMSS
jgi:RNA recognition motif-containing protein